MQAYKHQNEILSDPRKKMVLAHDTGTGKTFTAILLADHHKVKALIISPKSIVSKWEKIAEENGHYAVSKEWARDHVDELILICKDRNLTACIYDEAHFVAGNKSNMTKKFVKLYMAVDFEYMWLLTATPVLSTPWNVFTLAIHCGLTINYAKFRKMFFVQVNMGMRGSRPLIIWKPKANVDHLLHALSDSLIDCDSGSV